MIYIDREKEEPIYEQIYEKLVAEILAGDIKAGETLAPTRVLAAELSVSRNTVDRAYQQLMAEGYICSRARSGFTVSSIPLEFATAKKTGAERPTEAASPAKTVEYDFSYGSMDSSMFPHRQWRRSVERALTEMEMPGVMNYPDRKGEEELREAISRYLKSARDVDCDPSQIIITCGQQHSMEIIINMFGRDMNALAMEEPGYDGIRKVFENHSYEITPVPVESDGIALAPLEDMRSVLLYVTPSHQFPTGAVTSIAKRRQLLQWAEDTDSYIVEDDYDSELRYVTSPIPAMRALDIYDRTIYTGTFSKSLAPVMRTAYIVLPAGLSERYAKYYWRYNSWVNPLHQKALAYFMSSGGYQRHINRLRTAYRRKLTVLMNAAERTFGDRVEISGGDAGIHILMRVRCGLSAEELVERGLSVGVRLYDTRSLYVDVSNRPPGELLLGFPTVPAEDMEEIMERLAEVWGIKR